MKPNLIVVQTSHREISTELEDFFENFCETHYVYLIRPNSGFKEDSPAGIRFLGHSLDRLPKIPEVDAVISISDPHAADQLRKAYPDARLTLWDPEADAMLPDLLISLLTPTIVRGDFRHGKNLARAI